MPNLSDKLRVVFRYPNAKGLFVEDPDFKPGGAGIQLYTLATELAKDSRYDVQFWVEGEVPDSRVNGVRLFSEPKVITKGLPIVSRFKNQKIIKNYWENFRDSVCIFTVAASKDFPYLQRKVQHSGGKTAFLIASDVDVIPEMRLETNLDPFYDTLRLSDAVIAQTDFQKRELKKRHGIDSDVVPSTFCCDGWRETEKDILLWVGQAVTVKRPWVAIELARRFPQEQFVMIMPDVDKHVRLAVLDGAESITNLKVLAFVEPGEIQTYYNRAKIVLNTSLYEGYPNTLHQAGIGRAPYISLSWDPDELLEERGIGAGANNNVEMMAEIISRYLTDSELRTRQGCAAYENFKQHHDVKVVIESLKKVIEKVAMLKS